MVDEEVLKLVFSSEFHGIWGLFLSSQHDGIVVFQRSLSNPSPDHSQVDEGFYS